MEGNQTDRQQCIDVMARIGSTAHGMESDGPMLSHGMD